MVQGTLDFTWAGGLRPRLQIRPVGIAKTRPSTILPDGPSDFWVEVWNDDDTHFITISQHGRFDDAVAAFEKLIQSAPPGDRISLYVGDRCYAAHKLAGTFG